MNVVGMNLQTRNTSYPTPEASPLDNVDHSSLTGGPLQIPHNTPPVIPRQPLHHTTHNAHARATKKYNIVDDLAQSPTTISALEVLQSCPSQNKALLQSLGAIDPVDSRLIAFDLDKSEPRLPSSVAFHIPVTIRNLNVHRCIIDEGASTCIMSSFVWKKLGSPKLTPSTISLKAYDDCPSKP